jgi:GT2 family glycosyltransferase
LINPQPKPWPKVTVIIVNWNGGQFLDKCLCALTAQTVSPHEILLLDNASTDGSIEIARKSTAVRLLIQDTNTGFARGNNLAVNSASKHSEWIALLNPDAYPEPKWLENLLATAQLRPEFDAFGSQLLNAANPNLFDGTGDAYHISGLVWRSKHGTTVTDLDNNECEIFSPCAAAALYSHKAFVDVGGFDEDYFCYVEDVDLGFRMRLAGYRCLYVPNSIVHHVGSGTTGGQKSDFSVYHGHRNLVWTFVKNMPSILFWLLLPMHIGVNICSIVWFSLRGQGTVIARAKRDALLGLPNAWRKRKQIQETRVASARDIWRVLNKRILQLRK